MLDVSWEKTFVKTREVSVKGFAIELWEEETEICLIFSCDNKTCVPNYLFERKLFFKNIDECNHKLATLFQEYVEEVYLAKTKILDLLNHEINQYDEILKNRINFI